LVHGVDVVGSNKDGGNKDGGGGGGDTSTNRSLKTQTHKANESNSEDKRKET